MWCKLTLPELFHLEFAFNASCMTFNVHDAMQLFLKQIICTLLSQSDSLPSQEALVSPAEENNMDGRAFKRTAGKRWSIVPATLAGFRNLSRGQAHREKHSQLSGLLCCLCKESVGLVDWAWHAASSEISAHFWTWLDGFGAVRGPVWHAGVSRVTQQTNYHSPVQNVIVLLLHSHAACLQSVYRAISFAMSTWANKSLHYLRTLSLWISRLNKESCETTAGAGTAKAWL